MHGHGEILESESLELILMSNLRYDILVTCTFMITILFRKLNNRTSQRKYIQILTALPIKVGYLLIVNQSRENLYFHFDLTLKSKIATVIFKLVMQHDLCGRYNINTQLFFPSSHNLRKSNTILK